MRANIRLIGGLAQSLTRLQQEIYRRPSDTISSLDPSSWPSPQQPITPVGPPGSKPLGFPFWFGQNLIFTPRSDIEYTAEDLRVLSLYPLARVCIENTKDMLSQMNWRIQLRQKDGETIEEVQRRRQRSMGDVAIRELSEFLEYPDGETPWVDWVRPLLEDMLVVDAPAVLLRRDSRKRIVELRWIPGHTIIRYIDDQGFTPHAPDPAYAQLWEGVPRVNLTVDQLVYRPRNIVPRNTPGSYIYGMSPVEQVGEEIKIGIQRLAFVMSFYDKGSLPNVIQVVPPDVPPEKIREAMEWMNSELAGNLAKRRQWRMVQGFKEEGKDDQILFPKEPVLADFFDDLHIRKICFAFGTSPQRLQRPMNRGSAQQSQLASEQEGIRPFATWLRAFMNFVIQRKMGYRDHEFDIGPAAETDPSKQSKVDVNDVNNGLESPNEVRRRKGRDPFPHPWADSIGFRTSKGWMPIGVLADGGAEDPPQNPSSKEDEEDVRA